MLEEDVYCSLTLNSHSLEWFLPKQSPSLSNNSSLQAPLFESHWHTGRFTLYRQFRLGQWISLKRKKVMAKARATLTFKKLVRKRQKNQERTMSPYAPGTRGESSRTMNCQKSVVINVIILTSIIRTEGYLNLIIKRSLRLHF